MKKTIFMVIVMLVISASVTANPKDVAKTMKLKALATSKSKCVKTIKELTAEWEKPKPEVSIEKLRDMKHEYDSLVLDQRSQILTIEMEIAEVEKLGQTSKK